MSIQDYRNREGQDPLKKEALRPRRGFLVAAALFGFATLLVLMYRGELEALVESKFVYFFPFLIFLLIAMGLFMVACYRMPALGNRLLGYGAVLEGDTQEAPKTMSYTKGFDAESASSEKRQASRRLSARQARRKYARQTKPLAPAPAEPTEDQ